MLKCSLEQQVVPGKYSMDDFNFETPDTDLLATASGETEKLERYEYPGGFTEKDAGDKRAKERMEAWELPAKFLKGEGYCLGFASGSKFTLTNHERDDLNADYTLLRVSHAGDQDKYTNSFEAFPADVPFRPTLKTSRPTIHGAQTALVVGKSGEEIWTDKYGRIKVQFHWDRKGKKDEKSSCWIRVAQGWAGKQWGAFFLPRIGQEVVVSFLNGDPDRPLVTGSVYNAQQTVPYTLPDDQTKSTVKSNSSKGGNGFNEVRFEDKAGEEEIFIQAQKDKHMLVLNNEVDAIKKVRNVIIAGDGDGVPDADANTQDLLEVNGNRKITVKGDSSEETHVNEGKYSQEVTKTREITVKDKETHTTEKDFQQTAKANYKLTVDGDLTIDVKGKITIKSGKDFNTQSSANMKHKASQNMNVEGGQNLTSKAGMNMTVKAGQNLKSNGGMNVETEAGMNMTNKAGMVMKNQGGISIENQAGATFKNKADAMFQIEAGAMVQAKANAMIQVQSSGLLMLKGSLTMVN